MSEPELVFVADLLRLLAEREEGVHSPFNHDRVMDERSCPRCRLRERLLKLRDEYNILARGIRVPESKDPRERVQELYDRVMKEHAEVGRYEPGRRLTMFVEWAARTSDAIREMQLLIEGMRERKMVTERLEALLDEVKARRSMEIQALMGGHFDGCFGCVPSTKPVTQEGEGQDAGGRDTG
ncbi:MAG: hypothetical protein KGJ23_07755 [Euryarchaeota archaeon]|nr:hypothetical protein [Euryarchaeota archaeon]MDE1836494.1 hypothetical protein [Euryarchaeota archaeon]MDE1880241.1 hypothetical protein [Euryarchaeota archaeon]MDE2044464.1 hypothetical protein [Thermoplasmata archaeon]